MRIRSARPGSSIPDFTSLKSRSHPIPSPSRSAKSSTKLNPSPMRVLVTPDYRALSLQAGEIVADVVRRKPDAVLGLPTGHTPLGMYEDLVRKHREQGLDFSRVRTLNLDEYEGLEE